VTNVLIHVLNTGLFFRLLVRHGGSVGKAATAAALFALHPLHVESVAWISERKDVLSGPGGRFAGWAGTGRRALPPAVEKLPFFALAAGVGVATLFAREPALNRAVTALAVRLLSAVVAPSSYLVMALWPLGLTVRYEHFSPSPSAALVLASLLLLAVIWAFVVRAASAIRAHATGARRGPQPTETWC
jgi:hypothetical protein